MIQSPSLCNRAVTPPHISARSYINSASTNETLKKVVLVSFTLITATLAALAIYHQLLPLAIGAVSMLFITGLVGCVCFRGGPQPHSSSNVAGIASLASYLPFRRRAPLPPLPPIQESNEPIDWNERLRSHECLSHGRSFDFNLRDPDQPVAELTNWGHYSLPQLPVLGKYQSHDFAHRHTMAVRLPASQLVNFPQDIQDQFRGRTNIELFFLVFNDVAVQGEDDLARNIAMHAVGIPDRDDGIIDGATFKMYDPQGVVEHPDPYNAIPAAGHPRVQQIYLHPVQGGGMAFSPNNAQIRLQPNIDVASFFVTVEGLRGRNVAFHALIVKDPSNNAEGRTLDDAMWRGRHGNFNYFLNHLDQNNFIYAQEVLATFGRQRSAAQTLIAT
ncbi:MAG: hypothetical protein WAM28_07490 [Chlamydiales bacterium]